MRFFFEYRTYLIVLLMIITLAVYWYLGVFTNEEMDGITKSIPFIVIMIIAMIPTPERYRND